MLDRKLTQRSSWSIKNKSLFRNYYFTKLLRQQYPKFYKYSMYIYHILLKRYFFYLFRVYLQTWSYHAVVTPYFQFLKKIYLRDTLFFENLNNKNNTTTFSLNRKMLKHSSYKEINFWKYTKHLYGGVNYVIIPDNYKMNFLNYNQNEMDKFLTPFKETILFKGNIHFQNNLYKYNTLNNFSFEIIFNLNLLQLIDYYRIIILCVLYKI